MGRDVTAFFWKAFSELHFASSFCCYTVLFFEVFTLQYRVNVCINEKDALWIRVNMDDETS